jgi:hypothetical protein
MTEPLASIVLPVYNCEKYVGDAIESLLRQTFTSFELIVINDGSTDRSAEIVSSFHDPRISVLHQGNQGLAATLNRGISLARGTYVARQDADDLSHSDRLAFQVAYMEDHPDCVLLGTWAQMMEKDRLVERYHRHPVDELELRYELLFNNPFVHSSVLMRRSALLKAGGYTSDPERQPPEDYELWSRLSRIGSIANIGKVLQIYREIPGSISRVGPSPFRRRLIMFCAENIATASGLCSDDPSIQALAVLTHGEPSELKHRPDFARMQDILLSAINGLGTGDGLLPLREDAISRVQGLKAAWRLRILRETAIYRWLSKVRPLKSMAKKVLHSTRSLRKSR